MDKRPLLYVQWADSGTLPSKYCMESLQQIQDIIQDFLPEVKVLAGVQELKFTFVDPKQQFAETLAGTFNPPEEDK
jgi:hypothetical protein